MLKNTCLVISILSFVLMVLSFERHEFPSQYPKPSGKSKQVKNHPPVVKIISPKDSSTFAQGKTVSYAIIVSDDEDGESKYDEINVKEVFLKIKYLKNISLTQTGQIKNDTTEDPSGIAIIKTSNCMNCHNFKSKLIGPSFYEITKRYRGLTGVEDSLANHILNGSKGRWGNVQMPSNNKLTTSDAKEVIQWIFKNSVDSTTNFIAGLEGSFRIEPPDTSFKNIILIASYTDHGTKDKNDNKLTGKDAVSIRIK